MREFVDLRGASGSSYRFRLAPNGTIPLRIAGNYAILRPKPGGFTVAHLGVTGDLSMAREEAARSYGRGPFNLYVRLNVARSTREAEHEDLAVAYGLRLPEPAE
jgi:hypothetical protein